MSTQKREVLIPTKLDPVAAEILEADGHYQVIQDESADLPAIVAKHPHACALIVRSEKITQEIIDALPELKTIVRAGAGFNTIDTKYARKKGIDVMNTPGANANAVAEEVVALMLADARHIIPADASTRQGKWEKKKFMGREVGGKTVGIVGLGNIGRLVARRLSGFDVSLLGYDPVISNDRAAEMKIRLVDLETLFSESDYITLHIPENEETRGMVNEQLLSRIKPDRPVTIVNCARAGIIDEEAMRTARQQKTVRFLNDVYPKDAAGEKSVADIADIMMPHLGASTMEANYNAARRAAEQLIDFEFKGITSFIVNRDIPEGLDEAYCELASILARLCRQFVGRNAPPTRIETSFYGSLEPYGNWLLVPVVAGLWDDFDRSMDYQAARTYLDDMGIEYLNRSPDPEKGFESSITLEMIAAVDSGTLRRASVRGTVAEGMIMVSRINQFDKLWFEPTGDSVLFQYDDRPGVIGTIGLKLAGGGINIEDIRNPCDPHTNQSLAIMKVSERVSEDLLKEISDEINALAAFSLKL